MTKRQRLKLLGRFTLSYLAGAIGGSLLYLLFGFPFLVGTGFEVSGNPPLLWASAVVLALFFSWPLYLICAALIFICANAIRSHLLTWSLTAVAVAFAFYAIVLAPLEATGNFFLPQVVACLMVALPTFYFWNRRRPIGDPASEPLVT